MPPSLRVLIVDDEEAITWALRKALEREGYRVGVAPSAEKAFELAANLKPGAVILDIRLPGMDGLAALGKLRELTGDAPVIVITAHGNLSTAVRAVEGGAFDYLAKPFDLSQALDAVARAVKSRQTSIPSPEEILDEDGEIVGKSLAMQAVFKRIALVAPHEASVLITGESGSGKELVARAIHRHSPRRDQLFLPVHVAALNPTLVESELLGHVRGSFTGANADKRGLLVLADGGTVFLDELADIPLEVQAKLLRVLEHQEILPVGGNQPVRINIRILCATHQDLSSAVRDGRFRHDLYFRLNVFEVHIPPLRERPEDIRLLAMHFLRRFGAQGASLPDETITYLQHRPWPGNVRELRNALEHAAILARNGPLLPEHFPPPGRVGAVSTEGRLEELIAIWVQEQVGKSESGGPAGLYEALVARMEPPLLEEVMRQVNGNRLVAARWLGLARATLRKMWRRYHPQEAFIGEDEEENPLG